MVYVKKCIEFFSLSKSEKNTYSSLPICYFTLLILSPAHAQEFRSAWPEDITRVWVGPEYWANRLQDWRISHGRLECMEGRAEKPMRTVHLLTRRLNDRTGEFSMSVHIGLIEGIADESPTAAAGFLIGAGSELDYLRWNVGHRNASIC